MPISNVYGRQMPAGIPGAINRFSGLQDTIEPNTMDTANPVTAFGLPVKMGANGFIQPFGAGDAITALYGLLVRPYPTQSLTYLTSNDFGSGIPAPGKQCSVLKSGYMSVYLGGTTPAAKGGPVFIRVAAPAAGKPVGGFEAAADSTNTVAVTNAYFRGPADANGVTEIAYKV